MWFENDLEAFGVPPFLGHTHGCKSHCFLMQSSMEFHDQRKLFIKLFLLISLIFCLTPKGTKICPLYNVLWKDFMD